MHFDEKSMFAGDKKGAKSLKVKLVFWMTSKIPILVLCYFSKPLFLSEADQWGLLICFIVNDYKELSWVKQSEISALVPWVCRRDYGEAN